jgi:hypothetical protein
MRGGALVATAAALPATISAMDGGVWLAAGRRALLDAIANTVIPDTETVGAAKAGVAQFIEMIVDQWMDDEQRSSFILGMASFDNAVRRQTGVSFVALPAGQREAVLKIALIEAQAVQRAANHQGHAPFLVWMKRLTLHGYYTSEAGASQELVLNATPGEYVACHKMGPGERSFSMDRRHIPFVVDNEVARIK